VGIQLIGRNILWPHLRAQRCCQRKFHGPQGSMSL
jgi:hypothetical protein